MTIDAVIFDWGGTLTPWHQVELGRQWDGYIEAYDPALGAAAIQALLDAEADAWRLGREVYSSATLEAIISQAGLDPSSDGHTRGLKAYNDFWDPHTYTDPEVLPLFTALRDRGISVGVLSNTIWSREYHEWIFERDGVLHLIDGAVYSSEIEWTKPHPEAFRAAIAAVGAGRPEHTVYVGDRLFEDVYGPKEVGMRAVHIPHSDIPAVQRGHTEGEPDAVIQRLGELVAHIDDWSRGS